MARSRKPAPLPLKGVRAGDVFAMPLPDGRWGACRVLQLDLDPLCALVAGSPWIGSAPPDLSEPQLVTVFRPTHHGRGREPCVCWVMDPVPAEFVHVGNIPPSAREAKQGCGTFSDWGNTPLHLYRQWRWDHDRAALLAEDEAYERQQQEERKAREAAEEVRSHAYKPLPRQTLMEMRKLPFKGWDRFLEPENLRPARKAIRDTIDALLALGPDAPEPLKLNVFHGCAERFNENEEEDGWIGTDDRDQICDLLSEIAALVGLEEYDEKITGHRDW